MFKPSELIWTKYKPEARLVVSIFNLFSLLIKIKEEKDNGFEIVTNPAKDYLSIKISTATLNNSKAKLLNAQGLVVKTIILKQGLLTVDIANLPKGLYFLQTDLGIKKIVIEK